MSGTVIGQCKAPLNLMAPGCGVASTLLAAPSGRHAPKSGAAYYRSAFCCPVWAKFILVVSNDLPFGAAPAIPSIAGLFMDEEDPCKVRCTLCVHLWPLVYASDDKHLFLYNAQACP